MIVRQHSNGARPSGWMPTPRLCLTALLSVAAVAAACGDDDTGSAQSPQCPPAPINGNGKTTSGADGSGGSGTSTSRPAPKDALIASATKRLERGREIFRYE